MADHVQLKQLMSAQVRRMERRQILQDQSDWPLQGRSTSTRKVPRKLVTLTSAMASKAMAPTTTSMLASCIFTLLFCNNLKIVECATDSDTTVSTKQLSCEELGFTGLALKSVCDTFAEYVKDTGKKLIAITLIPVALDCAVECAPTRWFRVYNLVRPPNLAPCQKFWWCLSLEFFIDGATSRCFFEMFELHTSPSRALLEILALCCVHLNWATFSGATLGVSAIQTCEEY
jgi:hypothetical protein